MKTNDISIAQKIVENTKSNYGEVMFHNNSAIYKKSNEQIKNYQNYLENRKKVLSVIASSDQIINCILTGTKEIDAFDISRFPKYFMYLKLAALEALSRDEYSDFFYGYIDTSERHDDMYFDLIRDNLDKENKEFWDSLFNFYDWYDIYNSALFSSEIVVQSLVEKNNKYLDKNEYKKLKDMVRKVNINTHEGDIIKLIDKFKDSYDLAYLSNIVYYVKRTEYKEMLDKLNLENSGVALTYLYNIDDNVRNFFRGKNYKIDQFENDDSGVLVYKK